MFPGPRTRRRSRRATARARARPARRRPSRSAGQARQRAARRIALPAALVARLERRMRRRVHRRRGPGAPSCRSSRSPRSRCWRRAATASTRPTRSTSCSALIARDFGKTTVSLETPEAQVAALRMPPREATIEFVTSSLDELEAGQSRPLLLRLASAWVDGNLAELEAYERWCACLQHRRRARCDEAPARRPQPAPRGGDRQAFTRAAARCSPRRQPAHDRRDAGCLR